METTKALNALEPFLALSKSASSPRAAADLVARATSNPNTFLFTELLHTPQVQALSQSSEFSPHLALLQIFSYGTYADYQSRRQSASLPPLNDAQTLKLRQLTLLTLARDRGNLAYASLQSALSLPDPRALEALVISSIYAGLLSAILDPARQHVHVHALSPLRDLAPGAVPALSAALASWSDRCSDALRDIEARMAGVRAAAAERHRETAVREHTLAQLLDEGADNRKPLGAAESTTLGDRTRRPGARSSRSRALNKRGSNLMGGSDELDEEAMDLDLEEEEQKRASRRKL